MTNERDDDKLDDWFAANFADGQAKTPSAEEPPAVPPPGPVPSAPTLPPATSPPASMPPLNLPPFNPPPATFDPALGGAGAPPEPVGPPEPYPLSEPAMPNAWVNPPVFGAQQPPIMQPPQPPMQPPLMPQPPTFDPALSGQDAVPTEYIPSSPSYSSGMPDEANALDALFGEEKFRDFETEPDHTVAFAAGSPAEPGDEPPKELSSLHVTLMWVAGSVVAILALAAFFLVGTKLPMLAGSGSTGPSAAPTDPAGGERPVGPIEPGTYNWNELLGGECLEDFRGAWENEYTVVDCAQPHAAQLVFRGAVPILAGTGGAYPGVYDLQGRMNLLCTDAAVIDYELAKNFDDIQFEASFPPSTEDWDSGRRDYFCFVSRASGEPLEGSLAAPPAPDEPAIEEEGTVGEETVDQ